MKFRGKDISEFPCLKLKGFRQSYFSDFEHQNISVAGHIMASVEVATVRKIEAEFLLRWKKGDDSDALMRDVSRWLTSGGVDELYPTSTASYYYLARCDSVSMPEFKGRSAIFTAEFICADYRPYDTVNNAPIQDDNSVLTNFTYDRKHCLNDMGCLFIMDNKSVTPSVRQSRYILSGVSGTIRYDKTPLQFKERQIAGTLYLVNNGTSDGILSDKEIDERLHRVATWLSYAKRGYLIFDSDPFRRYIAEVLDETSISRDKWHNGAIKLKFTCQPYSESIRESKLALQSMDVSSGIIRWIDLPLDFKGVGYTTPLIVEIKNVGASTVSSLTVAYCDEHDDLRVLHIAGGGFLLNTGSTVIVDATTYYLHNGTSSLMKSIRSGDFPSISPNSRKIIGVSADANTSLDVSVRCNLRWL